MRYCYYIMLLLGAILLFNQANGKNLEANDKNKRPNILIIVTDDQGYADLSAYSHSASDIQTPNMDRIADEGVLFTQAYVSCPVCSPSRAGWLTGKYQQRWDPKMSWGPGIPDDVKTLAEYMKGAGYATCKIGKSDFGKDYRMVDVKEHPSNHGFDYFFGFTSHAHDFFLLSKEIEDKTPDPHGNSAAMGQLFENKEKVDIKQGYTTELFTDAAISFMKEKRESPFFVTLSYNAVHHLIHEVPDRYLEKYDVPKIPNYNPETMGKYVDYYNKYNQLDPISDEQMRKYYLANLDCLDDNIGRLIDALKMEGIYDNTLVIFFSDNGGSPLTGANNRPLRGSKYVMYEGGIRVPFAIKWPSYLKSENAVYSHRVSTLDIVPTCLEAAGIPVQTADKFDGKSFLKEVRKNKPSISSRSPFCWHFQKDFAVRDGDWKLVFSNDYTKRKPTSQILQGPSSGKLSLYNLKNDPREQENVIDKHPGKAEELKKIHRDWLNAMQK